MFFQEENRFYQEQKAKIYKKKRLFGDVPIQENEHIKDAGGNFVKRFHYRFITSGERALLAKKYSITPRGRDGSYNSLEKVKKGKDKFKFAFVEVGVNKSKPVEGLVAEFSLNRFGAPRLLSTSSSSNKYDLRSNSFDSFSRPTFDYLIKSESFKYGMFLGVDVKKLQRKINFNSGSVTLQGGGFIRIDLLAIEEKDIYNQCKKKARKKMEEVLDIIKSNYQSDCCETEVKKAQKSSIRNRELHLLSIPYESFDGWKPYLDHPCWFHKETMSMPIIKWERLGKEEYNAEYELVAKEAEFGKAILDYDAKISKPEELVKYASQMIERTLEPFFFSPGSSKEEEGKSIKFEVKTISKNISTSAQSIISFPTLLSSYQEIEESMERLKNLFDFKIKLQDILITQLQDVYALLLQYAIKKSFFEFLKGSLIDEMKNYLKDESADWTFEKLVGKFKLWIIKYKFEYFDSTDIDPTGIDPVRSSEQLELILSNQCSLAEYVTPDSTVPGLWAFSIVLTLKDEELKKLVFNQLTIFILLDMLSKKINALSFRLSPTGEELKELKKLYEAFSSLKEEWSETDDQMRSMFPDHSDTLRKFSSNKLTPIITSSLFYKHVFNQPGFLDKGASSCSSSSLDVVIPSH